MTGLKHMEQVVRTREKSNAVLKLQNHRDRDMKIHLANLHHTLVRAQ